MSEEFFDAISADDVDRLAKLLVSGADPSISSTSGCTPLQAAVYELYALSELEPGGPLDALVLLLRYGARANDWNKGHQTTPLLEAVMINHTKRCASFWPRALATLWPDGMSCGER